MKPTEWPLDQIETELLTARAAAINNTVRLRDLEYCRLLGVIAANDAELAQLAESAPRSVELYHLLRELYRRKRGAG